MKKTIGGLSVLLEGNSKNKAIIFLHGFPYDHTIWQAQIDAFSEQFYCIAYDIKGLGGSSVGDGQFTMESFVDDLDLIMSELGLDKPILCGHSLGGYIALRSLERMEEKFSAVILCDTTSKADNNEGKLNRCDDIRRINAQGLTSFSKHFVTRCYGDLYKKEHKEEVKKRIAKSTSFHSVGVKGCILAMISRNDTTDYLSKITIPTLVFCGEQDTLTTATMMKLMADKIKDSTFVVIQNSGHMSMAENPLEVNATIKKFLETF